MLNPDMDACCSAGATPRCAGATTRRAAPRGGDRGEGRRPGHLDRRGRAAAPRAPAALDQDDVEVVVIDNASSDATAAVAAELGVRYVRWTSATRSGGHERRAAQRGQRGGAVRAARLLPLARLRGRRGGRLESRAWARWRPSWSAPWGRARAAPGRHRHRRHVAGPPAQERAGRPRPPALGFTPWRGLRRRRRGGALPPRGARGRRRRRAGGGRGAGARRRPTGARTPTWPGGCG